MFESRLQTKQLPSSGAATLITGTNNNRWGIVLLAADNDYVIGNDNTVTISPVVVGLYLKQATAPVCLNVRDHGSVVQLGWYGCSIGSKATNLAWLEILACSCEDLELLQDVFGHRHTHKDAKPLQASLHAQGAYRPKRSF